MGFGLRGEAGAGGSASDRPGGAGPGASGVGASHAMTQAIEERVGKVEVELARHGERMGQVEVRLGKVDSGVEAIQRLLERRPEPAPVRDRIVVIAASAGIITAAAGAVWALVAHAPAVQALSERLTTLDHREIGKIHRLEERLSKLDGWAAVAGRRER
jgi:hypothetical protein